MHIYYVIFCIWRRILSQSLMAAWWQSQNSIWGVHGPLFFELFHRLYIDIIYTERVEMAKRKHQGLGAWGSEAGGARDLLGEKLMNLILGICKFNGTCSIGQSVKTNTQVRMITFGDLDFQLSPWKKVEAILSKRQGLEESNSQRTRTARNLIAGEVTGDQGSRD